MNNNVTIRLSYGVRPQLALKYAGVYDPKLVKKLTVTGVFNDSNFRDILYETGKTLVELDLSNVLIDKESSLWSFEYCPCLRSITFPASLNRFSKNIFSRWSSLTEINVHGDNPVFTSENGILFSKDKTILVRYPTGRNGSYAIPDTVIEIGEYAFDECKNLTAVTIPNSVVTIGRNAFAECSQLISVVIPPSVLSLEYHAFYKCTELSSVDMPKTLKFKRNRVFEQCEKLPIIIEERNKEIKQVKINQLQQTSAYDWIDVLMKNSKYPYKIEQHLKTRLQLSVMVTNRLKLEIPVSLRHFQTIIPKLMDTIQRYEACIKENEIMVFIEDTSYDNRYWKNKH